MDATIYPKPNPAIAEIYVSQEVRRILEERIDMAKMLYQAQVAKRSGGLAASAHTHVGIGGVHHDRYVGELTIGGPGPHGIIEYADSHEFGRGIHPESIHNLDGKTIVQKPADDLEFVLQELGSY